MRIVAYGLGALALAGLVYSASPAEAAKSKMGCMIGKEHWDATAGKCVAGKAKAHKAAKKAPAAKK